MGKIVKPIMPRHKETMPPFVKEFVTTGASLPPADLPQHLEKFPTRWPFPRGDLFHWIPLLNHFDSILERFCKLYKLNEGPQIVEFGHHLIELDGHLEVRKEEESRENNGISEDADRGIVESILNFSRMLLENCGNRSLYNSSLHLNDLLNTTSLSLLQCTLSLTNQLAQRFQASLKRLSAPSKSASASLLNNHYNLDLDRVNQLALPFAKTTYSDNAKPALAHTPSAKGKEKATTHVQPDHVAPKTTSRANDLVSLVKSASSTKSPTGKKNGSNRAESNWEAWGNVRVTYYTKPTQKEQPTHTHPLQSSSSIPSAAPSTPTPLRRTSNLSPHGQRSSRQTSSDDSPLRSPTVNSTDDTQSSTLKAVDIPSSKLISTPVHELIKESVDSVPKESQYELLTKIRVARALTTSLETRQQILAIRLLAVTNLAYIHPDQVLQDKVLKQDLDEPRRLQLIFQLAELVHPPADGQVGIPRSLQTVALNTLDALSQHANRFQDVCTALNTSVNHGVLLYVVRKAVAEMAVNDDSGLIATEEDEWRKALLSLLSQISSVARTGTELVAAGLLPILVEVLTMRTNAAKRHHHMIIQFFDTIIYSVKDAFPTLVAADGLDAISDLVVDEVRDAMEHRSTEGPTSTASYRPPNADYKIPYFQMQTMKWLLKFIHHMMTSSASGYGGNFDRLLRNLIDSPKFLESLRMMLSNSFWFGSVIWTNAVSILNDFINNEPTSFAVIAEAGLGKAFLEEVSGEEVVMPAVAPNEAHTEDDVSPSTASPGSAPSVESSIDENHNDGEGEDVATVAPEAQPVEPPTPTPATNQSLETRSSQLASGIMPAVDTINVIPHTFGALCLNENGMRMFQASSALKRYFEIFLSPKHISILNSDHDTATNLGNQFDELIRHHPPLRSAIINAILEMVINVNQLCKEKATMGAGAKLWAVDSDGRSVIADEQLDSLPSDDSMDIEPNDKIGLRGESEATKASITPYITAVASFLSSILTNSSVRTTFVEKGGIEHVLDLAQLPSLAFNFGDSRGCRSLQSVISTLCEHKPQLVLPSLIQRLQSSVDVLSSFAEHDDIYSYFGAFVEADGPQAARDLSHGTRNVKALTQVHCLAQVLRDCFQSPMFSHTRSSVGYHQLLLGDMYKSLVKSLGSLLGAMVKEEILLRDLVPSQVSLSSINSRDSFFGNDSPLDTPNVGGDDDILASALATSERISSGNNPEGDQSSAEKQPPAKKESEQPRTKNYHTLHYLLKMVQTAVSPALQVLGKILLNKRHEQYQRYSHALAADALVETIIQQLSGRKFEETPATLDEDLWTYRIRMLGFIKELLVDTRSHEKPVQAVTFVLRAFKKVGGFDVLNGLLDYLTDFLSQPKQEGDANAAAQALAEEGLHKVLELYGSLSHGKTIQEATQTAALVSSSRPVSESEFFSLSQFMVELRMSILPKVRLVWESDAIENVSARISNDTINIIRNIFVADFEQGAHKRADAVPPPHNQAQRPFRVNTDHVSKLKDAGYTKALIIEALYRCNNVYTMALEYCEFHKTGRAGKRAFPPEEFLQQYVDTGASRPTSQGEGSPMVLDNPQMEFEDLAGDRPHLPNPFQLPFSAELDAAPGGSSSSSEAEAETAPATTSATQAPQAAENKESTKRIFIDDLNEERTKIREKLIDRSLDIINAHGEVTFEIADLITTIVGKSSDPMAMRKEMGETLVNALMSFAGEDDVRPAGRKIAAYAHLLALMLQDKDFYKATLAELKENLSALITFVKVSPDHTSGDSSPWIANILLIVEILLSDDAQPKETKWTPPAEDGPAPTAVPLELTEPSVPDEQKAEIFSAILEILSRVHKDSSLGLAILRILVILTRTRSIAQSLGEKKNLQRLFIMAKGLAAAGSFTERLSTPLLIILRHIIEDDETIKQIMRADIKAYFTASPRSGRHLDLGSYIKHNSHLIIRSPKIFVEVTQEMVKLTKWSTPQVDSSVRQAIALKETLSSSSAPKIPEDLVLPTVQATEDLTLGDVKTSTETAENGAVEKVKVQADHKTPTVENPDGVIYFLLHELLNYRDVFEGGSSAPTTNTTTPTAEKVTMKLGSPDSEMSDATPASTPASTPAPSDPVLEVKDSKKPAKQEFKPEEHPVYIYRCLLLQCLTELLSSYNRTKIEFISFKRNSPLSVMTPSKPRSGVVHYLLYDLIPVGSLEHPETTVARKKQVTSMWADSVLCALLSKTGEQIVDRHRDPSDGEDEPDLLFVRRFVLENILKAYKEASSSAEPLEIKYSRMLQLADLMNHIMAGKESTSSAPDHSNHSVMMRSQMQLKRIMYEKGYIAALTASIADIDLNFPGAKRAVKYILRPLKLLTQTAIDLSESTTVAVPGQADDEISSASSVSEADEREETPDLFRNSALGMFEGAGDEESSVESADEDEEMYEDGYEDEEMEFEEEMEDDDEDNVSEEDPDIEAMGGIEGLSGDIGIEIEMSDDDEEEGDEDEDEDDEDEDMDDEDVDDDDDARIEIVEDDGNGEGEGEDEDDWESHDEDEEDYEAQADAAANEAHGIDTAAEILRRIEAEGLDPAELGLEGYMEENNEDEEDEEEDDDEMDDEMYGEYAGDPGNLIPRFDPDDPPAIIRGSRAGRYGFAPPFPFMPSGHRDPIGVPDYIGGGRYRSHRPGPAARAADDGVNPLLQRANSGPASRDAGLSSGIGGLLQAIGGPTLPGRELLDLSIAAPRGAFGENSIAFINELLNSGPLPVLSHRGHAVHLHVSANSPGDMRREFQAMFGLRAAGRLDARRDVPPNEAVQFSPQSTSTRWLDEAKLLFGGTHADKAAKILNALMNVLVPPAWEADKIAKELEKERLRKKEEELKKRAEEERIAKEAQEAKEKAEREQKEREEAERQAVQQARILAFQQQQAEARARARDGDEEPTGTEPDSGDAMDGVEVTDATYTTEAPEVPPVPAADRPRITTTIRGNPYDITDLGIDPEFLNELPEEIKEEVIMTAVADRRSQAAATGAQPTEIDREFLDALPQDIRDEIIQSERLERRRREREEARRAAAANGVGVIPQDMDAASIFATMSPELQRQVLLEQDEETIAHLPAGLAAQARDLIRAQERRHSAHPRGPMDAIAGTAARRAAQELGEMGAGGALDRRPQRRTITEMLDKSGVATLLRLMFVFQQGSLRSILCHVLQNVCENKNNRADVITTLLLILQDGSADMSAVERGFAQLSLRAKSQQPRDSKDSKDPKTPTGSLVKRSSTGFSSPSTGALTITHGNSEISPLIVIQQCLNTLVFLTQVNPHISSFFLTEHESTVGLKRSLSKKGKTKDSKAAKYALNSLLSLLDRSLIMESSSVMESLSDLLSRITQPLQTLDRKQKEAAEEVKKAEEAVKAAEAPPAPTEPPETVASPDASSDVQVEKDEESSIPDLVAVDEPDTEKETSAVSPEEREKKITAAKEAREVAYKRLRQLSPPVIPQHNLELVINIFVARECSSKTFRETLSTIKNLSAIPNAKETFGRELIRKAQALGEMILVDLGDLLPQIQKASTGTEIQGVALAKFSPGGSDQNKLLRVLTALDHLFDPKTTTKKDESAESTEKQDLLATLYENSTFGPMWDKLSACLAAIRQREHMLNVATILLPLIESLMVVCKNTTLKDAPVSQAAQDMTLTSPPPESRMESLFFTFTEEHRKILNDLVRHTPKLMSGTFSLLVKNPKVLEFDNKRNYFNRSIHNRSQQTRVSFPPLQLSVRRDNVFHDSYKSLAYKSPDEMKYGKLSIRFHGEEGVDAGGVTREWFQVLSRQMFDPDYALFVPVSSDRTTFHPNLLSNVNQEHLSFFKFIGRVIGKALFEGRVLDCHFSRAVYKRILGRSVSVKDMESLDPEYYKSLVWMLSNNITDVLVETFSVETDNFGLVETVDLIPNGRNIALTEENKQEYVKLVVEHRLQKSVQEQLDHFLTGFHEIIPAELVAIFNENELELLISGLPEIDVDDWKGNTEYHNYTAASPQIQWFWRAVRSFDKEERAKLLQFVTGTSKVPLNGFKELEGMNGFSRFNIHRDYGSKERLPSSHTCFNQLDLPEYDSYDALRHSLLIAITTGSEYFGFA